jgi:hypothetical protein
MAGIDRQDQILSYYPCGMKTVWWYMTIWIYIFQMKMLNAHNLHCRYSGKKLIQVGTFYCVAPIVFVYYFKIKPKSPKANSSKVQSKLQRENIEKALQRMLQKRTKKKFYVQLSNAIEILDFVWSHVWTVSSVKVNSSHCDSFINSMKVLIF